MINYIGQFKREKINTVIRSAVKRNKNIYTFLLMLPAIIYLLFHNEIIKSEKISGDKQATALLQMEGGGKCTAFLVSDNGLLLTARHCLEKEDDIVLVSFTKIDDARFQKLEAKVIYLPKDSLDDYAVLKLVNNLPENPKISPLEIAEEIKDPNNYNPDVVIIGYPGDDMTQTYVKNTVRNYKGIQMTERITGEKGLNYFDETVFQTNDVQNGMSGGPVIDQETGKVIGICHLRFVGGSMQGVAVHEKIQQVFNDPDASHIDWK